MSTQYFPVVPDIQCPLEDRRALAVMADLITDRGWTEVLCVGDEIDNTEISQWARGNKLEFAGKLDAARERTIQILTDLKVKHLSRSNHTQRIEDYVSKHAPGLSSLPELKIENFLRLDSIGVTFHRKPYEFIPGWILCHGDEGTLSQIPTRTAMGLVNKFGKSVVCGHTHRAGIAHHTHSSGGRVTRTLWGMEVGHAMDLSKAGYLDGGSANWCQSMGLVVKDGNDVYPFLIPIKNGRLHFDGRTYRG